MKEATNSRPVLSGPFFIASQVMWGAAIVVLLVEMFIPGKVWPDPGMVLMYAGLATLMLGVWKYAVTQKDATRMWIILRTVWTIILLAACVWLVSR